MLTTLDATGALVATEPTVVSTQYDGIPQNPPLELAQVNVSVVAANDVTDVNPTRRIREIPAGFAIEPSATALSRLLSGSPQPL
jgi:hypothetical protein